MPLRLSNLLRSFPRIPFPRGFLRQRLQRLRGPHSINLRAAIAGFPPRRLPVRTAAPPPLRSTVISIGPRADE